MCVFNLKKVTLLYYLFLYGVWWHFRVALGHQISKYDHDFLRLLTTTHNLCRDP